MVQRPAATIVTVLPLTVHTGEVSDAKLTGRPEDAVALTVNGVAPNVLRPGAQNVMFGRVSAAAEGKPARSISIAPVSSQAAGPACAAVGTVINPMATSVDMTTRAKSTADRATRLIGPGKIPPLGNCSNLIRRCEQLCARDPGGWISHTDEAKSPGGACGSHQGATR